MVKMTEQNYTAELRGSQWTIYGASHQVIGWISPAGDSWSVSGYTTAVDGSSPHNPHKSAREAFESYLRWAGYITTS
jgi:hypothetical protein